MWPGLPTDLNPADAGDKPGTMGSQGSTIMPINLARCWINQPSSHQPHYNNHGTRVLVDWASSKSNPTVYWLDGDCESSIESSLVLSPGWPDGTVARPKQATCD